MSLAQEAGRRARRQGLLEEQNPYRKNSYDGIKWRIGWRRQDQLILDLSPPKDFLKIKYWRNHGHV